MESMTSKERVQAVLQGELPDRVPCLTFAVDTKIVKQLGQSNPNGAHDCLGLDVFQLFCQNWCQGVPLSAGLIRDIPEEMQTSGGTFAGWHGVDEFGRLWERGSYVGGTIRTEADIERNVPELMLEKRMNPEKARAAVRKRPDKAFAFTSHTGPFGLTMESIGFEEFCYLFVDNRAFIEKLLWRRTEWFAETAAFAAELGADFVFMGDDVAFKGRTFISPKDFEELVTPCYRYIVERAGVPVIWHSDGYITPLLDAAVEAGLAGVHPLEPKAGVDLGRVKDAYGDRLILAGNVECGEILCQPDLELVRREVRRCMEQAKEGGRYILSDSNSIHAGCRLDAVTEMYRYAKEIGIY